VVSVTRESSKTRNVRWGPLTDREEQILEKEGDLPIAYFSTGWAIAGA
jgi:hypothetical protein